MLDIRAIEPDCEKFAWALLDAEKVTVMPGVELRRGRRRPYPHQPLPARRRAEGRRQPHPPLRREPMGARPREQPSDKSPRRHHRRRRLRLLGRLSSGQARLDRHRPARAQAADLGHDLARRRADRPVARLAEHDAARQIFGRPLRQARSRDRRRHRHAAGRLDHRGADRGAQARDLPAGLAGARLRRRRARDLAGRSQGDVSASQHGSDVVGAVHLPLDGQCDPANIAMALAKGARQRGAQDRRRRQGHQGSRQGRPRHRRLLGEGRRARHDRGRHRRQLRRHVGARARRAERRRPSRCTPASISISSPSRSPG